jgi:hypothetical protein
MSPRVRLIDSSALCSSSCIVVGCSNATNLLDGLDGLCGGVTAVIGAGFPFPRRPSGHPIARSRLGHAVRIILALALLGAVLGFVPYNFNPASIFMGDAGSMFLGYACAVMIILTGSGTIQMVPGRHGHVCPAHTRYLPRLRPPLGQPPPIFQRRPPSFSPSASRPRISDSKDRLN